MDSEPEDMYSAARIHEYNMKLMHRWERFFAKEYRRRIMEIGIGLFRDERGINAEFPGMEIDGWSDVWYGDILPYLKNW